MRISDWSSDVCSSDLALLPRHAQHPLQVVAHHGGLGRHRRHLLELVELALRLGLDRLGHARLGDLARDLLDVVRRVVHLAELFLDRSEEHTSELQSLMRISYAVFCLNTKKYT